MSYSREIRNIRKRVQDLAKMAGIHDYHNDVCRCVEREIWESVPGIVATSDCSELSELALEALKTREVKFDRMEVR